MPSPSSLIRRAVRFVRFGRMDHRRVFKYIYDKAYWGDRESRSGPGSSMFQTESIRRELPRLIEHFSIRSMIDVPCGDLYWIADILPNLSCSYIGGDIVPDLVDTARNRNTATNAEFRTFDITRDAFPDVDLWMCRDVLFHLSFANIRHTMENFARSRVAYILVTSHTGLDVKNRPIATGDFRQLNLLKPPFRLSADQIVHRFDDYAPPAPGREMLLVRREDFVAALPR